MRRSKKLELRDQDYWVFYDGKRVPIDSLHNDQIVSILRNAEAELTDREKRFLNLVGEAVRRGLTYRFEAYNLPEFIALDGPKRGTLERKIVGALKNSINAHGPITKDNLSSAAKRIIHAIKEHNKEVET